jgi:accessory colonization factor AcfC
MKKLLALLFGCLVAGGASAEGRLNLYCAYPVAEVCRALANGFGAAHDVKVSVVQKPTGELLTQRKKMCGPAGRHRLLNA